MTMAIIAIIVLILVLGVSIYLNIVLFKSYNSLIGFFNSTEEELRDDFGFFYKLSKTELASDTVEIREMVKRLFLVRDRFEQYIKKINKIKEE